MNESIVLQPIGRVHSPFKHAVGMPIQTVAAQQHEGKIEVFSPLPRVCVMCRSFNT